LPSDCLIKNIAVLVFNDRMRVYQKTIVVNLNLWSSVQN
jgi:hypothetical protein